MKNRFVSTMVSLAAILAPAVLAQPDSYDLSWHVISGGGADCSGGSLSLSATVGQHDAGKMSGGNYRLDSGFWGIFAVTGSVPVLQPEYKLTTIAVGGGIIGAFPVQPSYLPNARVTLTALAASGWVFSGWSGSASGMANPLPLTMSTNKSIIANFTSTVPDLIIDNPAATFTGSWSSYARFVTSNYYGADYRLTATAWPWVETASATFTPNIVTAGNYNVYVWYPGLGTNGSTRAAFEVVYDGGSKITGVNQTFSSQGWLRVAVEKPFAGAGGYVRLSNFTGDSPKYVVVDAVRFVYSTNQVIQPAIVGLTRTGTSMSFTFCAQPGRYYRVQYTDDLSRANWTDLQPDIWASAPMTTFLDDTIGTAPRRFYRMLILP